MKRKRLLWFLSPLLILALLIPGIPVSADIPGIPHAFYGTLIIGGSSAPVGTVVTAKVGGVEYGSITTTVSGQYGGSGGFDAKLVVSGDITPGATIDFQVGTTPLDATWVSGDPATFTNGGVTELNLSAVVTDSTAPTVSLTALTPDPTTDSTPTFTGTAIDATSTIASVEYKVDSGSWIAATASDGAFDEASESYTFTTSALSDGAHTVYVRATDSATNTTAEADYASDGFTVDTQGEAEFDPYTYDTDEDGEFSKDETVVAVDNYLAGNITKDEVLEVVKLYFS